MLLWAKAVRDRYPLSIRVLVVIVLISTVLALVMGVVQLRMRYANQTEALERRLVDIRTLFVPSLTDALWRLDKPLIATNLEALHRLPLINHISLRTREGERYSTGKPQGGAFIRKQNYPLLYYTEAGPRELGILTLEIDREPLFTELRQDAVMIFITEGIKTLLASVLILWMLHRLLFRHLLRLRRAAAGLDPARMTGAFTLDRQPVGRRDELEDLRQTLEKMRSCIEKGLTTLQQLHAEREHIYQAANAAPSALLVFDATGTPLYHNPAFEAYFNPTLDRCPAQEWLSFLLSELPESWTLQSLTESVRQHGPWQQEVFWQPPQSPPRWLDLQVVRYTIGDREHFCLNAVDVTELRTVRKRERHLLEHDRLTGLPNRTLGVMQLEEMLQNAYREHTHVAVIMVAVKAFKPTLESYGLQYADLLVLKVGKQLRAQMPEDALIARTSDNAFLCAFELASSDAQPVVDCVRGLRKRLLQPIDLQGQKVDPDFSAGVAISPNDGEEAESLLKHAHSALRQAQLHERAARWRFFDPQLYGQSSRQLQLAAQIISGQLLKELQVHYQPLVTGHDNTPLGCEALARWPSDVLGQVPPAEFIAITEQLGMIDQVGEAILRQACQQAAQWHHQGHPLFVSVNVSPRQLDNPRFVEMVRDTLEATGLPASALKLEITEQVILQPHKPVLNQLQALSDLGVTLAIDDFGTGYASLNYLCDYPFGVLKIDQSFVMRMLDDQSGLILVRGLIHLAHDLGLDVVAEGVETQALNRALGEMQCEQLQGFLFSRPLPAAALDEWLARHPVITGRQGVLRPPSPPSPRVTPSLPRNK